MNDLSWKDQLLLREAQRFEARDQEAASPRAPQPELASPEEFIEVLVARSMQLEDACEQQMAHIRYLQDQLRQRPTDTLRAVCAAEASVKDAERNRRAFLKASVVAGIMTLVAIVGWVR
jgi:hypothetical protein